MHYRHTQVGWVILGVAALVLLVFSSLTVEVDHQAIRLRFGVGLVRKRIGLADVSSWRAVRNPWYSGWGIRLGPGYVLWNVSGLDAVELVLADGRRFRIGTDEPAALTSALTQAKGVAAAPTPPDEQVTQPRARIGTGVVVALLAGTALVGWIFWSQIRPPRVRVGATGVEVDTLFYGRSVPASDIVGISLEGGTAPCALEEQRPTWWCACGRDSSSSISASRSGREPSSRRWLARGPIASTASPRPVAPCATIAPSARGGRWPTGRERTSAPATCARRCAG